MIINKKKKFLKPRNENNKEELKSRCLERTHVRGELFITECISLTRSLPFLKANMLAFHNLGKSGRKHEFLESETQDFITHNTAISPLNLSFQKVKQRAFPAQSQRGIEKLGQHSAGFLGQDWAHCQPRGRSKTQTRVIFTRNEDEEMMPRCFWCKTHRTKNSVGLNWYVEQSCTITGLGAVYCKEYLYYSTKLIQ